VEFASPVRARRNIAYEKAMSEKWNGDLPMYKTPYSRGVTQSPDSSMFRVICACCRIDVIHQ
jgi:hypothetical protein